MPAHTLLISLLVSAWLLAGCALTGEGDRTLQPTLPAQWSVEGSADGLVDLHPTQAAILSRWWQQFADPVLSALIADALDENLDLAAARAQLRAARAQRRLSGAALGPTVDVSASASHASTSGETGSAQRSRTLYSTGFDASWEIDLFGGLRQGVEAAQAEAEASLEDLRTVQVSLTAEVALAYVELRTAEQRLALAEDSLRVLRDGYDLARWRREAGLVSELDAAQARTQLEAASAALPSLRNTIAQAQNRLAVLLGRAPGELGTRLAATAQIPLATVAIATGIPADTLRQRPDVRAAERRVVAQVARLGQAQAARYPSLRLSGSIGLEALAIGGLGSAPASRSLLAAVTAPIFDAGRIRATIAVEDARLEQARLAYQAAVLTALREVEDALVSLASRAERRERLEQAVATARETRQLTEQRYASGLVDFLTVLDSQRTFLDLQDQLAVTTGELASAQIQLYKALGGGWTMTDPTDTAKPAS
ncbi:efflux transporter outer membrane subunit [Fontimonas thermophila]|nr:efflux transporter outer membrane subunit [Fontimonas thermophila]